MKTFAVLICVFIAISCTKKTGQVNQADELPKQDSVAPQPQIDTVPVGLEIGNRIPNIKLLDTARKFHTLSDLKGKMVLVDFWASWCYPCKMENRKLIHVYSQYKDMNFKDGKGFEIFAVSTDSKKDAWKKFLIAEQYTWPVSVLDTSYNYAVSFKATSIPTNYLVDGNGIIVSKNLRDTMVSKTLNTFLK
jgi:thiol-disulfide isomerase/thioredoxin